MATSRFYKSVQPRRQVDTGSNDVERGLQVGQSIGKLLGGFGDAIKQARQDAVANQLMDTQAIANQPGAGVTKDLGTLPADTGAAPDDNWTLPNTSGPVQGATDGTVGSLIHTGGVDEMKLRQEAAKEQLSQQNVQAEIARRKAAENLATLRSGLVTQGGNQPQPGNAGGERVHDRRGRKQAALRASLEYQDRARTAGANRLGADNRSKPVG
jgi:hypothetical protein